MSFSLTVEGDLLMLETGVDWLIAEDGLTNVLLEVNTPVDLTASALLYGSVTLKFNTLDFGLIDPPVGALQLTDTITTTDPAWTGTIAALTSADPTLLRNNHQTVTVTATNTRTLPSDTAPFDLSDVPTVTAPFDYLLESGSGHYLLESGTDFATATSSLQLEGALAYGYSGLSVRQVTGSPSTTLGRCAVWQPGLRPGNTVHVTSLNQGLTAVAYQINQVTVTFAQGANPPVPAFLIEFGDTPQTLAAWTAATAPVPPPLVAPVVIPSGPVIYGQCGVGLGHGQTAQLYAAGGGIVTVASATFSVSAAVGHTLTCQVQSQVDALAYAWSNFVGTPRRALRCTISGGIYTGAWVELPGGWTGGSTLGFRTIVDLSSVLGIALASGTYTVTIDIDTQGANQIEIFSGWANVAVTTV